MVRDGMAEKKRDCALTQQNDATEGAGEWLKEILSPRQWPREWQTEVNDGRKRKAIVSWHDRMTQQKVLVGEQVIEK